MSEDNHNAAATDKSPLYVLCADLSADNHSAFKYVIDKAARVNGRIGLLGCIRMDDFQSWASVEGAVRQELHEQCEKELWILAGQMKDMGSPMSEFLIEEGAPMEALGKIVEKYPDISEVIIALSRADIVDYLEPDAMRKLPVPLVFMPPSLR